MDLFQELGSLPLKGDLGGLSPSATMIDWVQFGSARLGSAWFGLVQLGSAWLSFELSAESITWSQLSSSPLGCLPGAKVHQVSWSAAQACGLDIIDLASQRDQHACQRFRS